MSFAHLEVPSAWCEAHGLVAGIASHESGSSNWGPADDRGGPQTIQPRHPSSINFDSVDKCNLTELTSKGSQCAHGSQR